MLDKTTKTEYEEYLEKTLTKIKKNPDYELLQEFGKLLMKNINDFTPEELTRYEELKVLLHQKQKVDYVVGFLFSPDKEKVVLIKKNRPTWQKDYLNGIGGKIKDNEIPVNAIIREFEEETGITIFGWKAFASIEIETSGSTVWFFHATDEKYSSCQSITDEKVLIHFVNQIQYLKIVPNLSWLIPMALDENKPYGIVTQKYNKTSDYI